jgi:imidazolonepropionase-like amidohydrolase
MKNFLFCLSLLLLARAAPFAKAQAPARTLITNVYIVSPENLDHVEKGHVLIEDGRIAKVERGKDQKRIAGAEVVDGKGQYLIPGLIDSHVHLASVPGVFPEEGHGKMEWGEPYFKQLPRSYLYYGYTTLVDLAVINPEVMANFRHAPLHPDLYDCGRSLPLANGYPMSFLPLASRFKVFSNFIYDPKQADRIPAEYKPEDHTPAADVAHVKSEGGICVKTYFERGFAGDRNLPVISPEMLAEIRKASSQDGLVLMIHANTFEAQKFAVDGNVDVIAHGMWNWRQFDKEQELPDEIRQVLDQIVAKKIGYQPTMQVMYGLMAYFDPEYLKMDAVRKVVPRELLVWFQSADGKWFGKELNEDAQPDAEVFQRYERSPLRRVQQVVRYLAGKDANFVFGTDTPSAPTYGNLPGLNGYLEMKQLHTAGMSLAQIFRAATISNAREFHMESQLGTIEPGKIANLVLLKKSPLQSVEAYDSITTVFVHGKAVQRESLAVENR